MPLAIFGIGNTALNLAVTIVVLVLVAVWLALIVFTFTDARRRISDPFLVGCATAASLFPYVGTMVYTILRPPEFLEDVRERETEIRESEIRLRHLEHNSCHKCGTPTEVDYLRCTGCRTRLKQPCPECSRPVGLDWKVCPYCEKTLIAPRRSSRGGSRSASASRQSTRSEPAAKSRESSRKGGAEPRSRDEKSPERPERKREGNSPASRGRSGNRRRVVDPDDPRTSPARETRTSEPDEPSTAEPEREPINRGRAD